MPPAVGGGAWIETVLYSFTGQNGDGEDPASSLVIGSDGVLFGTTVGGGTGRCGTVFKLTPPEAAGGAWTETVLHSFVVRKGDGAIPFTGLVIGPNGVLYGTTSAGGTADRGTVFAVMPPVADGGPWTETVLHSFKGPTDRPLGEV